MNFYYSTYAASKKTAISKKEWEDFGCECLTKLFRFMGVPSEIDLEPLVSTFKYKEYKLGELIVKQNEIAPYFYFIIQGSIRFYSIVNGVELTRSLLADGNVFSSPLFYLGGASDVNIVSCTKLRVLALHYDDLMHLVHNGWKSEIDRINIAIHTQKANYIDRLFSIIHLQGAERIKQLYNQFPDMFIYFSSKHIASLLGLQPATFSKLKNQMLK